MKNMNDYYECNQCLGIRGVHNKMVKKICPDFPNNDYYECSLCGSWELHEMGYVPHYFLPRQVSRVEVQILESQVNKT